MLLALCPVSSIPIESGDFGVHHPILHVCIYICKAAELDYAWRVTISINCTVALRSSVVLAPTVMGIAALNPSCETAKETLIKLIPFMVRQAHHERNQQFTVRPEPVEGLDQRFLKF